MRAITIRNPYADQIMRGVKLIENRSWTTKYRGELVIHAGIRHDGPEAHALPKGILGVVQLTGVHHSSQCARFAECAQIGGLYIGDLWHWELERPSRFLEPIPCAGRLGLWEYQMSHDV